MPKKKHTQRTEADIERELDSLSPEDARKLRDILIATITDIPDPAQSLPPEFRHLVRGRTMDDREMALYIGKRLARRLGIPMDEFLWGHPNELLYEWEAEKLLKSAKEELGPSLGEQLKAAREAWGHSQEAAAEELEVDSKTIAEWEHGDVKPRNENLKKIRSYISSSQNAG